ncbi:MAG: hypothetical protein AAF366_10240 [Pseudomonadota bacterium]
MMNAGQFLGALAPKDHSLGIRARVDRLSAELATERHADLGTALRSDFSRVSVAAHDLRTYQARSANLSQAAQWGGTLQVAFDGISSDLDRLVAATPAALTGAGDPDLTGLGEIGATALTDMMGRLEARLGERGLFSNGLAEDNPWPDAKTILADLSAAAATAADLTALTAAVEDYFAPTGTYGAAVATLPGDPVNFPFGQGQSAQFPVSAGSPEIVDVLRQVALVAVLPSAGFDLDPSAREDLKTSISGGLIDGKSGLSRLQGRLGAVEARVADLAERSDADRNRQEAALADAIAPDPFDVAIRLQAEMSRLESTYAITARRSRLNLTSFIR